MVVVVVILVLVVSLSSNRRELEADQLDMAKMHTESRTLFLLVHHPSVSQAIHMQYRIGFTSHHDQTQALGEPAGQS